MADAVLQHLDGAKLLLGILSRGERRDQVEQLQCDRVCNLLRNAKLSTMDAGRIAHAVHDTGFSAEHSTFKGVAGAEYASVGVGVGAEAATSTRFVCEPACAEPLLSPLALAPDRPCIINACSAS